MADSIYIQLSDPWRQAVTITPEIARQIVAMGSVKDYLTDQPAAPADDLVEMARHLDDKPADDDTTVHTVECRSRFERWYADGIAECDTLKAEVARLRAKLKLHAGDCMSLTNELEGRERDLRDQEQETMEARAAHAEAATLLNQAQDLMTNWGTLEHGVYSSWVHAKEQHLTKHQNKDTSK